MLMTLNSMNNTGNLSYIIKFMTSIYVWICFQVPRWCRDTAMHKSNAENHSQTPQSIITDSNPGRHRWSTWDKWRISPGTDSLVWFQPKRERRFDRRNYDLLEETSDKWSLWKKRSRRRRKVNSIPAQASSTITQEKEKRKKQLPRFPIMTM